MKKLLILIFVAVLGSCTKQLEKPFVKNTVEVDLVKVKKEISQTEYKSLVRYIKIHKHLILGETYKELVKKAVYYDGFKDRQEKSNQEAVDELEGLE